MLNDEFKEKYPKLHECLVVLSYDNDTRFRDELTLPENIITDLADLEEMASRLSDEDRILFCAGEEQEAKEIMERHNIHPLDKFLNDVFDGDLADDVWMNA